jgi:hypothetical protein
VEVRLPCELKRGLDYEKSGDVEIVQWWIKIIYSTSGGIDIE